LLTLVLVVAAVALYLPVLHHPFLNYDDDDYVTTNPKVQAGLTADTVTWAFTTYHAANWHPVTWLSHALDAQLYELAPSGHHATNLLLHVLNVVLLFWVLVSATGHLGRSALVAALFALHPINVESVAWIAERKNLVSMTFFLLTLGAWRWYARRPSVLRYSAVAVLFALGLMSKPQVITLPFVLLLWDFWPLHRVALPAWIQNGNQELSTDFARKPVLALLAEKLPLLALSAASAWVTMRAQQLGGGIDSGRSLATRLADVAYAYVQYLFCAIWPAHLAILYPFRGGSLGAITVAACVILLVAITATVVAYRRRPYLPVGWFWFLGTLVPMVGFVQVGHQSTADRYAYLPFIGLFLLVGWGIGELAARLRIPPAWQAASGLAVLIALSLAARHQLNLWSDNVLLWSHAAEVTQDNIVAEDNLGRALQHAGRSADAMPHFARSAQIDPSYPYPFIHMGVYLHQQGDLHGALANYQKVISLTTDESRWSEVRYRIFANMASAYASLGDLTRARDSFAAAVRTSPDVPEMWTYLGTSAQQIGDLDTAVRAFSQAVKLQPSQQGYLLLAAALRQSGKEPEAQVADRQAALLGGASPPAQ
jgi:regulator of sirC expression with transglutaminase-like and TPR domain